MVLCRALLGLFGMVLCRALFGMVLFPVRVWLRCDGGGLCSGLRSFDGEDSEKVFAQAEDALHFLGCLGFVRVVDDEVVSFAVLPNGIGERAQPPGFGSLDACFGFLQVLLCSQGDVFGLAAGEVLAQDENLLAYAF